MSTMYKAVYGKNTSKYGWHIYTFSFHFTYSMQELYYSVLRSQVSRSFWLNALIDEIFDVRALQLIHWLPCVMAPTIAHPPNDPFHARRRGGGGAGARKGPNVPFHAWRRGGGARKGGSYAISAAHLALNLSLAPCGAGGDRGN